MKCGKGSQTSKPTGHQPYMRPFPDSFGYTRMDERCARLGTPVVEINLFRSTRRKGGMMGPNLCWSSHR